jgi:hypothetical protein
MTNAGFGIAASRRVLMLMLTALIAALAVSFAAPREAQAIRDPSIVSASHVGWVQTRSSYVNCLACAARTYPAYRWSGGKWESARITAGIDVYVYPYSSPWHWIWTQRTGWLAVQNQYLTTGYSCLGIDCPVF